MFSCNNNKGFHITFANGWTVSVQFGAFSYCANKNKTDNPTFPCPDAEVAAWDSNDVWHHFKEHNDDVKGWMSANDVLEFMNLIAAYKESV